MSFGAAVAAAAAIAQSVAQQKAIAEQQKRMAPYVAFGQRQLAEFVAKHCNYCRQHSSGTTCKQCGAPRD
jgi:hypothetical protein